MFYIRARLWYQDELIENKRKWGVKKNVVTRRGVRVMITRSSRTQSKWKMILSLEVGEHGTDTTEQGHGTDGAGLEGIGSASGGGSSSGGCRSLDSSVC